MPPVTEGIHLLEVCYLLFPNPVIKSPFKKGNEHGLPPAGAPAISWTRGWLVGSDPVYHGAIKWMTPGCGSPYRSLERSSVLIAVEEGNYLPIHFQRHMLESAYV